MKTRPLPYQFTTSAERSVATGTLYAALDQLRAEGIVDVDREEVVDSRLRRYYKLTQTGAAMLAAEADRIAANAKVATTRLRTRAAGA